MDTHTIDDVNENCFDSIVSWIPNYTEDRMTNEEALAFIESSPSDHVLRSPEDNFAFAGTIFTHPDCPKVAHELIDDFYIGGEKRGFVFASTGGHSSSIFKVHRDHVTTMAVCLNGTMDVSIWDVPEELQEETFRFTPEEAKGTLREKRTLNPGDAVVFPVGTYHLVEPSEDRVSVTYVLDYGHIWPDKFGGRDWSYEEYSMGKDRYKGAKR